MRTIALTDSEARAPVSAHPSRRFQVRGEERGSPARMRVRAHMLVPSPSHVSPLIKAGRPAGEVSPATSRGWVEWLGVSVVVEQTRVAEAEFRCCDDSDGFVPCTQRHVQTGPDHAPMLRTALVYCTCHKLKRIVDNRLIELSLCGMKLATPSYSSNFLKAVPFNDTDIIRLNLKKPRASIVDFSRIPAASNAAGMRTRCCLISCTVPDSRS